MCELWLGIFKGASQPLPWPCVSKESGPGQAEALAQDLGLKQNDVKMRGVRVHYEVGAVSSCKERYWSPTCLSSSPFPKPTLQVPINPSSIFLSCLR